MKIKKISQFISRGAVLGMLAGILFALLQVAAALITGKSAMEVVNLFTTLYVGPPETELFNSFELTFALWLHLVVSMAVGVVAAVFLQLASKFADWRRTVIAAAVFAVSFWLLLVFVIEPQFLGSNLLETETNLWLQLFLQVVVFASFAGIAQDFFQEKAEQLPLPF